MMLAQAAGAFLAAALLLASPPAAGGEAEVAAEAALDRMIASESAVLDTLETIEDSATLEREREALQSALTRARRDRDAVADHADAFGGSEGLRSALASRMRDYTARRDEVYARILDRLDEDELDRLDAIFDAAD